MSILVYADNGKDRQTIIDFINRGEEVDIETVGILALELDDTRRKALWNIS